MRQSRYILNGDIRKSYIRRGSGDHQCTEVEIKTFLRDAEQPYDSEVLSLDVTTCFDEESIRWYRTAMAATQSG